MKKQNYYNLMQVLVSEKRFDSKKIDKVLSSDIFNVIKNYMEIDREDLKTQLVLEEDGSYVLRCKAKAKRIKVFGVV